MSLRLRRGIESQRSGFTFDAGEPIWVTNTEKLYIGDGTTVGGKSIIKNYAGTGLHYNSTTDQLELATTVTSDAILEGNNNLYFTPIRAKDTVGMMLENGTNSGIDFVYNEVSHTISATVAFDASAVSTAVGDLFDNGTHSGITFTSDSTSINAAVEEDYIRATASDMFINGNHAGTTFYYNSITGTIDTSVDTGLIYDTSPQLGGDLDLNNFDVVGYGNLDFYGNLSNGSISIESSVLSSPTGTFDIGSFTQPTNLNVTTNRSSFATFNTKTSDNAFSYCLINTYKDSLTAPNAFQGGDYVSAIAVRGWNPNSSTLQPVFSLYGAYAADADFTKALPTSELTISTGSNTDDVLSAGNRFIFDGAGTFSAPRLQTGVFDNTIERNRSIPIGSPGMLILLSSDGVAEEITGYTQVSSGAQFTVVLSQNVYTPTKTSNGTGYAVGEKLTILGSQVGGSDGVNDLTITITAITGGGSTGPISTFTSTGAGADLVVNYPSSLQSSTSGTGSGAHFYISVEGDQYAVTKMDDGNNYAVNDTLTFLGASLGGATPANNLTITVTAISGGGAKGPISAFTFAGTAVTLSETYLTIGQDYSYNTTTLISTDASVGMVGKYVSGTGILPNTTVASVDAGVSIVLDTETTLNVATSIFTIVAAGTARFQGCTVAGSGIYGEPGYVEPTWVDFN